MNNSKFENILLKIKEIKLLIDKKKLEGEKVDKVTLGLEFLISIMLETAQNINI